MNDDRTSDGTNMILGSHQSGGYRRANPTAVQAWRTCPLWAPSPSHPVLVYTRGLVLTLCISFLCILLYVYMCDLVAIVLCFFPL